MKKTLFVLFVVLFAISATPASAAVKIDPLAQLRTMVGALTKRVDDLTARIKNLEARPMASNTLSVTNTDITASDIKPYMKSVVFIWCKGGSGSGVVVRNGTKARVLTNYHVIKGEDKCFMVVRDEHDAPIGMYDLKTDVYWNWNSKSDSASVDVIEPNLLYGGKDVLEYSVWDDLGTCDDYLDIATPVMIVGYPASATTSSGKMSRLITNGIISGYNDSDTTVTHPQMWISNKMDSGNSGGLAVAKTPTGLCWLGVPTWLRVGNYDTQGIVQNINNVFGK